MMRALTQSDYPGRYRAILPDGAHGVPALSAILEA
jgi:hypothetical protein